MLNYTIFFNKSQFVYCFLYGYVIMGNKKTLELHKN